MAMITFQGTWGKSVREHGTKRFRVSIPVIILSVALVMLAVGTSPWGWRLRLLILDAGEIWLRQGFGEKPPKPKVNSSLKELMTRKGLRAGDAVFIRIFKEESLLELWMRPQGSRQFILLKSWPICAWSGKLGPKLQEGDGQSPEGFYAVRLSSLNPKSRYHLSFNLGFPNAYDRAHGRTGSFLMVHGACVSAGCFAMTNAGIEPIYALVQAALKNDQAYVPVHIFPFRMTAENMAAHAKSRWINFWRELKEGYDLFEASHVPPQVRVHDGHYVFEAGK